jgi:aspartate/methionine/tyrosine aminotransferase
MRERIAANPEAFFGFWLGQSYREPPASARIAGLDDHPDLYRYGSLRGEPALVDAVIGKLSAHNAITATPRNIIITAGGAHAAACATQAVLGPGDEVLLLSPHWPYNRGHILATGARYVEVPFFAAPGASVAERIEPYVTPRTAAILFASPNNPDGHVMTDRDLAGLADVALRHDLWVLADEVYEDFVYDGTHRSISTLDGMASRTLTMYSVSKSYSMAGCRIGYVVAAEPIANRILGASCHSVFHTTILSQRLAANAIRDGRQYLEDAREDFRGARDTTVASLGRFGVTSPPGGLYVFVHLAPLTRPGFTAADLLDALVDEGIPLCPGDVFGAAYGEYARLCFGAMPRPRLQEGLARLVSAFERFQAGAGGEPRTRA